MRFKNGYFFLVRFLHYVNEIQFNVTREVNGKYADGREIPFSSVGGTGYPLYGSHSDLLL